jgi:hypothetical protein
MDRSEEKSQLFDNPLAPCVHKDKNSTRMIHSSFVQCCKVMKSENRSTRRNPTASALSLVGSVRLTDMDRVAFELNGGFDPLQGIVARRKHPGVSIWQPGDEFWGGPTALGILNLTNAVRGAGVGGNKTTGAVAIYFGASKGRASEYPNILREDQLGWSWEYCVPSNLVEKMQIAQDRKQPIRIFVGPKSPFRKALRKTTLYWNDGMIVDSMPGTDGQTVFLLRISGFTRFHPNQECSPSGCLLSAFEVSRKGKKCEIIDEE